MPACVCQRVYDKPPRPSTKLHLFKAKFRTPFNPSETSVYIFKSMPAYTERRDKRRFYASY